MATASLESDAGLGPGAGPAPLPGLRDVLALALVEARRYGDDDDIWVRELVQNARDAGARSIRFTLEGDDVVVDDDGCGMSRAVVIDQLLRLFSSSKDRDRGAAGCFGVGFWSVLRARPTRVEIDSHDGRDGIGVVIDVEGGALSERPAQRRSRGTSIRLVGARPVITHGTLKGSIDRHAAMVDGRDGPPPGLLLQGPDGVERLNRPFSLDGVTGLVASAPVAGPGFSGFIGLSTAPRVELFHHGLRVVEATSLSTLVPSLKRRPRRGLGLVMRVDAPGLKVLVDRRTVVEDDVVRALVEVCDAAATRLERAVLDDAAPLPLPLRVLDLLGRVAARPVLRGIVAFALAIGLGVGGGLAMMRAFRPDLALRLPWALPMTTPAPPATEPRLLSDAVLGMGAPRIDVLGQTPAGFALATRHIDDDLLAVDVRSRPDVDAGLRPTDPRPRASRLARVVPGPVVATAQLRGSGATVLPSSLVLWPASAFVAGRRLTIRESGDGLPLVEVPDTPGGSVIDVYYGLAPPDPPAPFRPDTIPALTPIVVAAAGATDLEAVRRIGSAVAATLRYSASPDDAEAFNSDPRPLVERALALGVGDCDVINTVYVRALQQAGFPARLARGFVVRDDAVATELHAWGEVFVDGTWHRVDASPPSAMPVPTTGGRDAPAPPSTDNTPVATPAPTAGSSLSSSVTLPRATDAMVRPPLRPAIEPWPPTWALRAGLALATIALLAVLLVLVTRRGRRGPASPRDDVLELVVTGLQSGAASHLGLLDRPIVPTDQGLISLARARTLASRGRLAMARGARRHPALARGVHVLDREHRWIVALRPFLPRVVDLDGIEPALEAVWRPSASDDAGLRPLQARIDRAFRAVALRAVATPGLREIHLCTRDGRSHQILVGPDVRAADEATRWRRLLDETTSLWMLRGRR